MGQGSGKADKPGLGGDDMGALGCPGVGGQTSDIDDAAHPAGL